MIIARESRSRVQIQKICDTDFSSGILCVMIGLLLIFALVPGVSAFSSKYHYDLAVDTLRDEGIGIGQPQIWYVAEMDNMVDLTGLGSDNDFVDFTIVPHFSDIDDSVIESLLYDNGHFEGWDYGGIKNAAGVDYEWGRLQEQTYREVKYAEAHGDTRHLLATLGMSLHTAQDFYAHTNWADLTDDGTIAALSSADDYSGNVTWFDVNATDRATLAGQLYSDSDMATHDLTNKDYASRPHFDTAYRQAYYTSRQWIRMVRSWVSDDFWNAAMAPDIDTSGWGSNWNHYFMGLEWFTGAWNGKFSTHYFDLLTWYTQNNGLHIAIEHADYREPWYRAKVIGADLYSYSLGSSWTPEAHPRMEDIPEVRWLRLQTLHAQQTDCDAFWDIDPGSHADFYPIVTVNSHAYYDVPDPGSFPWDGQDDLYPNAWVDNIPLPMDAETVDVRYALWDDDHPWSSDDHCDIVWEYGQKDWVRTLSTGDPKTVVVTNGLRRCTWYWGSYGDGDEARVELLYEFIPQGESAGIIGLEINANPDTIHAGDPVTYTYTVTNEGGRPLSDVSITDDAGFVPVYREGDVNTNVRLDAGEVWNYTGAATPVTTTGNFVNTATVTATDTWSGSVVKRTAAEIVFILHPAIQVEKTVSSPAINRGESVMYTYNVTNTGDVRLGDITVTDDKTSPQPVTGTDGYNIGDLNEDNMLNPEEIEELSCTGSGCLIGDTDGDGTLSPEEIQALEDLKENGTRRPAEYWMYTATSSPTNTITNTVTVSGTDPLDLTISAGDSATVVVTVLVSVDIRPGGCPNSLNMKSRGVLPVAILGGLPDYTLDEIDISSVRLNGITPERAAREDVATPYLGTDVCGCNDLKKDGNPDASFKFDTPLIAGTMGITDRNAGVPLTLTGTLTDGITLVRGGDCVRIVQEPDLKLPATPVKSYIRLK